MKWSEWVKRGFVMNEMGQYNSNQTMPISLLNYAREYLMHNFEPKPTKNH
jgi:hypothetical protein